MSDYNIDFQLDVDHRRCLFGDEPLIFHCNHYNTYLQRTIFEDSGDNFNAEPILVGAAAEVAYSQLKKVFTPDMDHNARKAKAAETFKWAGFGLVDFSTLDENGGTMKTKVTHYSSTWRAKFGPSAYPVDFFTTGWTAGALAAIYDFNPKDIQAKQTACTSVDGTNENAYEFKRGTTNFKFHNSVGVGQLTTDEPIKVEDNNVDYDGILTALAGMPIVGNDEGLIPAFGVVLTRHYANYYNRVSFDFVREMEEKFGTMGAEAAEPLLIEAGHQCAFNTFGGIMTSQEWDGLIKPQLKTKADWVHGIVAAVNALGWGRWQVNNVSENGGEFTLHNDYESVGYTAMYGKSSRDINYLSHGGVVGIFNLVYLANIEEKPALTPEFYLKHFKGEGTFKAKTLSSRAMGDQVTRFEVFR